MGNYRAVVRHVRYWRGAIHRWSTVYQFGGTPTGSIGATQAQAVLTADDGMCYGANAADGGTYECQIYDHSSGGVPITSYTAFDWTTPGSWIKYGGAGWAGVGSAQFMTVAEAALQVEWAAGLSSSGKPVFLRKWYHAVPQVGNTEPGAEVPAAQVTTLQTQAAVVQHSLGSVGLIMQSAAGRLAGSPVVKPYFGNHQMPRGRRRKSGSSSSSAAGAAALKLLEDNGYSIANDN